ncbi:rCG60962 [Rattus norvegicus]|uniref:RCG60962 n=1 Tax=Rattus norvegicus TaxID=10116 RepID=A6JJL4_RAT|nr:rCG60962 [Rattus norvegicus]
MAHSLKESAAKALLRSDCHLSTQASPLVESAVGSQIERKGFNPWGLHCHQAHLSRLCSQYPEDKRHRLSNR